MNHFLNARAVALLAMLMIAPQVVAGPGHDHGGAVPAAQSGKSSPRFEAHSDLFEAVGVLSGGELSVTVDRYDSNAPVLHAKVELESGAFKAAGKFRAAHGDYSFEPKTFEKPGSYPISLTISAGEDIDILAGNLVVPDPATGHARANDSPSWTRWLAAAAVLAALAVAMLFIIRRRATRIRHA
ncbi:MAG: hypothetical protein JNK75_11830 [Betaproteobacteria bacterium]|nr:hypothetical protein [Betaproteobacteria bacterium]